MRPAGVQQPPRLEGHRRHRRRSQPQPCGGFLQGRPSGKAVLVGCWLGSDELGDRVVEVEVARLGQELVVPVAEGGLQLGIEPDSRARR